MGYSADLIQGSPIKITNPSAVLDSLREAEKTDNAWHGQGGHISWCNTVETYIVNNTIKYTDPEEANAHALKEMMFDYGFDDLEVKDGALFISTWGGDKLGSSWDHVWEALSMGYTDDPVYWIMCGEDNTMWCQMLAPGLTQELSVKLSYEIRA